MNYLSELTMPMWTKTPGWVMRLFPQLLWQMPDADQSIYLTFDDGPTPDITDWVLEQLHAYQAKATFFCIGKQAALYPQLLHTIEQAGHTLGNHTYHHLNGWKTPLRLYVEDITACAGVVKSGLFRPPYGKITPAQMNYLLQNPQLFNFNQTQPQPPVIVMWSIVSADWNRNLHWKQCLANVLNGVSLKPSAYSPIVVLHDSIKAAPNLRQILPRLLDYFAEKQFLFKAL